MGVTRKIISKGNGADRPKAGDAVTIEYTGNLYDEAKGSKNDFRGKQFDTSKGRGPFKTEIGVGKVIKGWDEGVTEMTLGEKSILTISGYEHTSQGTEAKFHVREETRCQMANTSQTYSDYAYGEREVELKAINDRKV
ncbi:MAG: FK506-binding protein 2B [Alectoria sarmentosa]|nr:MAG: FK506-binding protein 2B [Alectoria sarmentosa]